MVKFLLITLLIFTFQSKSFSNDEVTRFDNLVERNKVFFKKFSNEPFTGRVSDEKYEGFIQNGNVEGKWVEFHKNGKPKFIGNFRNGLGNGEFSWFSDSTFSGSSHKTEKRTLSNGIQVGFVEYYWIPSGELRKKFPLKNGKFHGRSTNFHSNGNLSSEKEWVNGKQHGVQKDYFKNGKLEYEFYFLNGVEHGPIKTFYENGKPKMEGYLKNGWKNGEIKFFDPDGTLNSKKSGFYKDGKKVND